MVIRRHPIRAFFGGLIFGLGVALALVFAGIPLVGQWSVVVILVLGIIVGLAFAYLAPARRTVTTVTSTPPREPPTTSAPPPPAASSPPPPD